MNKTNPEYETVSAIRHSIFILCVVVVLCGMVGISSIVIGPLDLLGAALGSLCLWTAIYTAAILIPRLEQTIDKIYLEQQENHHG